MKIQCKQPVYDMLLKNKTFYLNFLFSPPCRSEREADAAFWKAVKFRDVELAVRLVRGGVDCEPGGENWCLLVSVSDNARSAAEPYVTSHVASASAHAHQRASAHTHALALVI